MNLYEKYLLKYHETVSASQFRMFEELPADVSDWPEEWQEAYEERAAIMEYDGGLSPVDAEKDSEWIQREAYSRQQTIVQQ